MAIATNQARGCAVSIPLAITRLFANDAMGIEGLAWRAKQVDPVFFCDEAARSLHAGAMIPVP